MQNWVFFWGPWMHMTESHGNFFIHSLFNQIMGTELVVLCRQWTSVPIVATSKVWIRSFFWSFRHAFLYLQLFCISPDSFLCVLTFSYYLLPLISCCLKRTLTYSWHTTKAMLGSFHLGSSCMCVCKKRKEERCMMAGGKYSYLISLTHTYTVAQPILNYNPEEGWTSVSGLQIPWVCNMR